MIIITTTELIFIIVSCTILGSLLSWGYFEYRQTKEFKRLEDQTKVSQGMAEVAFTLYKQVIDSQEKEIKKLKDKLK